MAGHESNLDSTLLKHHDASVRTTVTLDADTERLLRGTMRERNLTFKAALNEAIRQGLRKARHRRRASIHPGGQGEPLRAGIDPSRLHDLDAALEVEAFKGPERAAGTERKTP